MRASTIVMIAFAAVFGLLAVFLAQTWLSHQAELRMKNLEAQKKPLSTRTIVVASRPLRFGQELSSSTLREAEWPENAMPPGAFAKIADLTRDGKRVVLGPIDANEPVLGSKITGPGQRATLSAVLSDGMKAVTIRVNDVEGVAGFVLPGDRVDVVMTRQMDKNAATNDIVLQNARVLAVDQLADERAEKPSVVKAVTMEVDTVGAQKLTLAASVGNLSLMLRKAGEANAEYTRRISITDLGTPSVSFARERRGDRATVVVTRASIKQEYSVPVEASSEGESATVGQR